MSIRILRLLCVIILSLFTAHVADAALLLVDIGVADPASGTNSSSNDVQTGFSDFSVAHEFALGTEDRNVFGLGTASSTFGGIEVQISGTINGPVYRDFTPDLVHPLGDLLEDGVDVFGDLFVTVKNIPTGMYRIETWHHRTDISGSAPLFDIFANTGSGEVLVADNVVGSTGTSPASFTSVQFLINATAGSDVVLRFDGQNTAFLNGFTVTAVPEPSAALLMTISAIGIAGGRRVRRRKQ